MGCGSGKKSNKTKNSIQPVENFKDNKKEDAVEEEKKDEELDVKDGMNRHKSEEGLSSKQGTPRVIIKEPSTQTINVNSPSPTPDGQYSHTGEWSTKGGFICLFCGGKTCKHEDYTRNPNPAIIGLHSDFVTPYVIASQRLSTNLINKYDIIQQFLKKGVKGVFNLQEIGEHPNCGDGLETESGMSYLPEELVKNGIGYYHFGWKDMNVPQIEQIINLVQVMHYIIQEGGKILVHCHAGLGRTGVAIACYILYAKMCPAWEAIRQVRLARKKTIQNAKQKKFIEVFALCMQDLKILFPVPYQNPPLTLNQYIIKQEKLLNLQEKKSIGMCPKLIYEIVERINLFTLEGVAAPLAIGEAIINGLSTKEEEEENKILKVELNKWNWKTFFDCKEVSNLVTLLFNFLDVMVIPAIQFSHIENIWNTFFLKVKSSESPKNEIDKAEFSSGFGEGCSPPIPNKGPFLKKYMNSLAVLECIPLFKKSLEEMLEKPEHSILTQIVRLLSIFENLGEESLKDKICSRICISLLGLKEQEYHCFLGGRMLTTKFNNSSKINKLNEILCAWTTLYSSTLATPGRKNLGISDRSTDTLSKTESMNNLLSMTVKSLMLQHSGDNLGEAGMYFGNILHGISTLPEEMQVDYFQKFNVLLKEASRQALTPSPQYLNTKKGAAAFAFDDDSNHSGTEEMGMGTPINKSYKHNDNLKKNSHLDPKLKPQCNYRYIYVYRQMMNKFQKEKKSTPIEHVQHRKEDLVEQEYTSS